jgi:hypothetical protein
VLNPDYRDLLSLFSDTGVEFLVVGAYALAAHGNPRATGDIDLWVKPVPENARRVLEALSRFGAPDLGFGETELCKEGAVVQIGVAPRRIDLLTSIDGVEFGPAWENRLEVEVEGLRLPVLGREDCIRNKRATGRPKDLADAEWLEHQRDSRP